MNLHDFHSVAENDFFEICNIFKRGLSNEQITPHTGTQRMPFEIAPRLRMVNQVIDKIMP